MQTPNQNIQVRKIIDVSKNNGIINWQKVKQDGVTDVIIRLWIANYNNPPTPPLPVGWTKYFMWQYTDSGTIAGIKGNVDLSKLG